MKEKTTNYMYWSSEEDAMLKRLKLDKTPLKSISTALNRSIFSVKNRLRILGINKREIVVADCSEREVWRSIPDFSTYSVSDRGRVKNAKGQIMRYHLSHNGYPRVSLRNGGGPSNLMMVHRLVAEAFLVKPVGFDSTYQANHIDGCKTNNRTENLEWVTPTENMLHAVQTGLKPRGKDCSNAILTEEQVHEICRRLSNGRSVNDIRNDLELMHLSEQTVRNIRQRKTWKHISVNYLW